MTCRWGDKSHDNIECTLVNIFLNINITALSQYLCMQKSFKCNSSLAIKLKNIILNIWLRSKNIY